MRDHDGVLDAERYQAEDKLHIHNQVMDALEALLDLPMMHHLTIEGFTFVEVTEIMRLMLPNYEVHPSNVQAILSQTNGHPVHLEQIVYYIDSLGSSAQEALEKGGGLLSSNLAQIAASSMTHIILSRVDGLRPAQQLTLKVCSVLGPSVALDLLVSTYPLVAEDSKKLHEQLIEDLTTLCHENFLEESLGEDSTWSWHSTVARDIVYEVIPFNQRRLLHARLAEALENRPVLHQSVVVPRSHIAYHWTKSCSNVETVEWKNTARAVASWRQAAADMDQKGAYLDAVRCMTKSLALSRLLHLGGQSAMQNLDEEQEEVMPTPTTMDIALQYKFIADMYQRLVMDEQVLSLSEWWLVSILLQKGGLPGTCVSVNTSYAPVGDGWKCSWSLGVPPSAACPI